MYMRDGSRYGDYKYDMCYEDEVMCEKLCARSALFGAGAARLERPLHKEREREREREQGLFHIFWV